MCQRQQVCRRAEVVERERCVFQAGEIEVVQLNSPGLEMVINLSCFS
jgi:hypothetical protein